VRDGTHGFGVHGHETAIVQGPQGGQSFRIFGLGGHGLGCLEPRLRRGMMRQQGPAVAHRQGGSRPEQSQEEPKDPDALVILPFPMEGLEHNRTQHQARQTTPLMQLEQGWMLERPLGEPRTCGQELLPLGRPEAAEGRRDRSQDARPGYIAAGDPPGFDAPSRPLCRNERRGEQ